MRCSRLRIGFLAIFLALFAVLSNFAIASTYTKNSFPAFTGHVITCDGDDIRLRCDDTGDGRNHHCSPFGINGCRAVEGRNNFGSPGCLITCQKEDRCSDKTPFGQCSITNPFYCDSGTLVKRASFCGCVLPKIRSGEDCITVQAQQCTDGTLFGQCSPTKPLFCNNGVLINLASTCGCPSGQVVSGNNCITPSPPSQQTCNDGTAFGQCSQTKPLFCQNGILVNKSSSCGCPAGQIASGNECIVNITQLPPNVTQPLSNVTQPPQVGVSITNKLSIVDIDAKVDGKTSNNIRDNGKISKEAKPNSDVELRIKVKNEFNKSEDIDIQNVQVRASIEGIDNGDDIEEESDSFDLRAESDKIVRFKFKIPLKVEEGTYNIFIEAEDEDENGNEHKDDADIELEVEKEKHDLRFLSFDLSPKIISCNRNVNANAKIINIGKEDEENAFIEIKSEDLGLSLRNQVDVKADINNDIAIKILRFSVSNAAEEGTYSFSANAYSEDGKIRDRRAAELNIVNCQPIQLKDSEVILQISPPTQIKRGEKIMPLFGIKFEGLDAEMLILLLAVLILVLFILIIIFTVAEKEEKDEEYY